MRSVMALSSPRFNGPFGRIEFQAEARFQVECEPPDAKPEVTLAERARCRPAFAGEEPHTCRAMETRQTRLASHPKCWLGLEREIPFRTAGKDGQASSVLTFGGPTRPKKPAPSLL